MSGAIFSFNRPSDRFVIVSNDLVEDVELKHAAFRIVVYIGRHATTFRLTQHAIGRALGMDRGTVARHLVHLEELGYLRRVSNFTAAGRQPDDLYVSQERMTEEQWAAALPSPCGKTPQCETPHGKTQQRKKTNSKKTNRQEDQLSEGTTADAAPADESEHLEEDVKLKPPADAPALFEVAAPPKAPEPPSSKDVVAAYVDSFRAVHGREPMRRDIGRVARESKALLTAGEASIPELLAAATAMGRGAFSNIGMQVKINRSPRSQDSAASSPLPVLHGDPRWDGASEITRQHEEDLLTQDPDLWVNA